MGRRRQGLQHMIATNDQLLEQCKPPNISWRRYMEHCELAVNVPDLHSDRTPLTSNRGLKKYKVKFIRKFF